MLHSTFFCMYICIAYIKVIDGIIKSYCTMKTLMNQIKYGTLLTGIIFLSYISDLTIDSEMVNKAILNSAPAIGVNEQKSGNENLSLYFSYRSASKDESSASITKRYGHPNHMITALPISFGTSGASLVSN